MKLFRSFCEERAILCEPERCFQFLAEFPEKYRQISLF